MRAHYVLGIALTLLYAVSFQLVPLAVRELIHTIDAGAESGAVSLAVGQLLAASGLVALFRFASRIALFRAGREIEYQLRNDFFTQLQRLPQSYFASNRTGDLMSRAVNDINSVRMLLGMALLQIVQTPVLYLLAIAVMASIDPWLTLFVVLPYPLFIGIGRIFARRIHAATLAAQEQLGQLSTAVQENAAGVLIVRSYAMEDEQRARFEHENESLFRKQIRLAVVNAAMFPTVGLLPAAAQMLVLYVGASQVRAGLLSAGDLWAFYTYIFMLAMPTFMMGWVIALAQRGLAGLRRLGEVLDVVPTIRDRQTADVRQLRGDVEVRKLRFAYPDQERLPALRGVSLRARAGETVGIVGPIGSGKSTLVSAIPRLLEVPDDTVFIDGLDLHRIPLSVLRSGIAMVPQDAFLFSSSVADNIRFGLPDAPLDLVREAARRAHVLEDVEAFPFGFDTLVGERGVTLSGGQRQRIALARALLLDPAILILDDSLSSVDAATEEAILKELRNARAGRTCFIVAHRLTAVRDADQILVLDAEGAVAERGSHAELVGANGFYARLYRQQQLEAELDAEDVA